MLLKFLDMETTIDHKVINGVNNSCTFPKSSNVPFINAENIKFRQYLLFLELFLIILFLFTIRWSFTVI